MENFVQQEEMDLPPGFRFHPTDEELITHYLSNKVVDANFSAIAIGEVDMNKTEPWELPWKAKIGEKEWYFFCVRDKKYPTGLRTNRATSGGYWKATGKDKEIYRGKCLVGMKKTLVFYKGRAPRGEKTNWVTHEYRLEGRLSVAKTAKNDWVICRVFQKTSGGKKIHISGLMSSIGEEVGNSILPPLTDTSPTHVHCFSNFLTTPNFPLLSNPTDIWSQTLPHVQTHQTSYQLQDPAILRNLLENYGHQQNFKKEKHLVSVSQETALTTDITSALAQHDLHCLWTY